MFESSVRKNGRPSTATRNHSAEHDFIELFQKETFRVFEICSPLYDEGHSLNEISKLTGIPFSTIHDQLSQHGVAIRPNHHVSTAHALRQKISTGTAPAYGFRCLGGVIERDSKQFPVLQIIHSQWRLGKTATAIMHYLNGRQIKTRHQKIWQRTTVLKIIERFKDGSLLPDEGD